MAVGRNVYRSGSVFFSSAIYWVDYPRLSFPS